MGRRGVDWSKAGERLRVSPAVAGGRNPDWDWINERWKRLEDYAAESLTAAEVVAKVRCTFCCKVEGAICRDPRGVSMSDPHPSRRRAAGAQLVAEGWRLPDA